MAQILIGLRKYKANYNYLRWYYWDTVLQKVTQRQVREQAKTYNNATNGNYKDHSQSLTWSTNETIEQYCDGTDLKVIKHAGIDPTEFFQIPGSDPPVYGQQGIPNDIQEFVTIETTVNHISCVTPCDISFDDPPLTVTHETAAGTSDGTVNIHASSIHTPLEYSLNDADWQASNNFTGLAPGTYTAYAKDNNPDQTCKISLAFTINPFYGVIFTHSFDQVPKNTTGVVNEYTVNIGKKGYSGSTTIIDCSKGDNPVTVRYIGDDQNPLHSIVGSKITVELLDEVGFQFHELFNAQEREYKIDLLDQASNLKWTGYLLPGQSAEAYDEPPYEVEIGASDGLGYLRNIPFSDDFGRAITGTKTKMDVICTILRKLNLNVSLYESVDVYEDSMTAADADSPLTQVLVNTDIYYNEDQEAFNCYDVLAIQLEHGLRIFQSDGNFHIERIGQKGASYVRRKFDLYGNYLSHETYDPKTTFEKCLATPYLEYITNRKKQAIQYNTGAITNFVDDGGFELWTSANTLEKWTKTGTATIEQVKGESGSAVAFIGAHPENINNATYLTSQQVVNNVSINTDDAYTLTIDYYIEADGATEARINWQIKVGDWYFDLYSDTGGGTGRRYGEWVDYPAINDIPVKSINQWNTYEWRLRGIPAGVSGPVQVSIWQAVDNDGATATNIIRSIYDNVTLSLFSLRTYYDGRSGTSYTVGSTPIVSRTFEGQYSAIEQGITGDPVEVFHGDGPGAECAGSFLIGSTQTDSWYRKGKTESLSINEILLKDYMNLFFKPIQNISGQFAGNFPFVKTMEDTVNQPGKIFIQLNSEWDVKDNIYTLELAEINSTDQNYTVRISDDTNQEEPKSLSQGSGSTTEPINEVTYEADSVMITDEFGEQTTLKGTSGQYLKQGLNGPEYDNPPTGISSLSNYGSPAYSLIQDVAGTLYGLNAGSNITISSGVNGYTISAPDPAAGGEVNTISSVGAGASLVSGKDQADLQVKSLTADNTLTLTGSSTEVNLAVNKANVNYWIQSGTSLSYTSGQVSVNNLVVNTGTSLSHLAGTGSRPVIAASDGSLSASLISNSHISGTANIGVSKLAAGQAGQFLKTNGGTPAWSQIGTSDIAFLNQYNSFLSYYTKSNLQTNGEALVNWDNIFGEPSLYTQSQLQTSGQASVHWGNLTNKPTTLGGYFITDAYTKTNLQTSGQASVHWENLTNKPTIIDGSGTAGTIPVWSDSDTIGDSLITQSINATLGLSGVSVGGNLGVWNQILDGVSYANVFYVRTTNQSSTTTNLFSVGYSQPDNAATVSINRNLIITNCPTLPASPGAGQVYKDANGFLKITS